MNLRKTTSELTGTAVRWCVRAVPLVIALTVFVLVTRAPVEARVHAAFLGLGQQMMSYGDALVQDAPRTVVVNGVALQLSAGATDDPVPTVLDEYERRCTPAAPAAASAPPADEGEAPLPFGEPVRAGNETRGFVACVGDGSILTADGVVDGARRLVESRDLTSLGALHYVYAERRGGHTQFIVLRADRDLNIERMFPPAGDAPGDDAPGVARPPDGRRKFSLHEVGYPYGITIYGGSPRSIDEHERFYRRALEADGWHIARASQRGERAAAESYFAATRGGALTLVVFGDEPSGTSTTILTTSLANP